MSVGEAIREARHKKGWTQRKLGQKLGVSATLVSLWEQDRANSKSYRNELERVLGRLPDAEISRPRNGDEVELDAMPSEFGNWVRGEREKRGWSPAELADKAGVAVPTIYNIEGGKSLNPQKATRDRIAEALGTLVPSQIVEDTENEQAIEGLGSLTDFEPHDKENWPRCPGIYVLYDVSDRPIYIGKASNIRDRLASHSDKFWFKAPIVQNGAFIEVKDKQLRHQLEQVMIKFLKSNAVINKQSTETFDRED
jgi:transcriptional regulator with XRE-family HTH domain